MIEKSIKLIDQHHALVVFPIKDKPQITSLWKALYPKSQMRWDWSDHADQRVVDLWHNREKLSKSGKVVYTKWFQNRATFLSKELFTYLLAFYKSAEKYDEILNRSKNYSTEMKNLLEALDQDSPLSTKVIKEACGLQGRLFEAQFNRTTKYLWQNLCLVAYGEIDDSSFPSLGYSSPKVIFEKEWQRSQEISLATAEKEINLLLKKSPEFLAWAYKVRNLNFKK